MNIVLSTDNKYVMPTGILMCSVCMNTPGHVDFFILIGEDFNDINRKSIQKNISNFDASVFFLIVQKHAESMLPMGKPGQPKYITVATYYRLFLQNILPETIDKVLYLDGDIICRSSLFPLWNVDIEDKPIAAVYEIENNDHRYERLCFDEKYGYFNAGVLLINIKYWREHGVQDLFFDYIKNHSDRILYHDQDVLNSIFYKEKIVLDVKYNALNSYFVKSDIRYLYSAEEVEEARKNPVLVHYSSHLKPWYKGCGHPYTDDFLYYKKRSLWKNVSLRTFPSNTFKGKLSNLLIIMGMKKYNGNYISSI